MEKIVKFLAEIAMIFLVCLCIMWPIGVSSCLLEHDRRIEKLEQDLVLPEFTIEIEEMPPAPTPDYEACPLRDSDVYWISPDGFSSVPSPH